MTTTKIWTKLAESGTFLLLLHAGKPGKETAAMTKKKKKKNDDDDDAADDADADADDVDDDRSAKSQDMSGGRKRIRALAAAFILGSAQQ